VAYPYPVKFLLSGVPYEIGIRASILKEVDTWMPKALFRLTVFALKITLSTGSAVRTRFGNRNAKAFNKAFGLHCYKYQPELCRGLAILHVLAPVKGGWLAPPIPKRFARSVPRDLKEAKPSPCC